jgi:hypothetical protein
MRRGQGFGVRALHNLLQQRLQIQTTGQSLAGDAGTFLGATSMAKYVVKMGATACFTHIISYTYSTGGTTTLSTVQGPSGETVASGRFEPTGTGWMVTCPGFQEKQFDQSCGDPTPDSTLAQLFYYLGTQAQDCTAGHCDF